MTVTIAILFWMRNRSVEQLDDVVSETKLSFMARAQDILGEPTDRKINFSDAESLVESTRASGAIRDLFVTKRLFNASKGRDEAPVVPFDLLARYGPQWRARLSHMIKEPIRIDGLTYGYLYFDLDRSAVRGVNLAIGASSFALAATLLLLIGRVYRQESSLVKVGIELDKRKRELIRIERLALAGQLSANLLHDLKKPVLHIRHSMEDLQEALGDFGGATAAVADTQRQIELFFQMLNDNQMERFVRSDRVQAEYVDINEILGTALRLVHYERGGIEVEENLQTDLPPVLAQPFQLVQLFSNLILNAYQAMGERGKLNLETRGEGGGVEILITDSGPGIATEHLLSIFEPFFSTKSEADGSGLGLAISRMIIDELGGTIEVDSRPGGPTTFSVRLPAEAGAPSAPDTAAPQD